MSRLMDGLDLLQDFGSSVLRDFRMFVLGKLSEVKIVEVYDLLPRVMTDERPIFTSEVRVSGSFKCEA
jgi:hypothetical protein